MKQPKTIAIDGPSGAGKSVIGERLAKALGYVFLDTGAMYRAVALAALQRRIDPNDETAVTELANSIHIDILRDGDDDGRQYTVLLDDEDVTWEIRRAEVEKNVSLVARIAGVRKALVRQQQLLAARRGTVMVGRDIATVVLPNADLKIFLTASPESRARRRKAQQESQGIDQDFDEVLKGIHSRDVIDSSRSESPLVQVPDAVVVNTDNLTLEETFETVLNLAAGKAGHVAEAH